MIRWIKTIISEWRRTRALKKRIAEIKKMDPFIYD